MDRVAWILIGLLYLCPPALVSADTVAELRKTGVLKIGYRDDVAPFSSLGEDGQPQGYSIDLCQIIATKIGEQLSLPRLTVDYVRVTAASRLSAVANGRVHIECGNTTSTLSRQEIVDFSNLFYVTGASFMTVGSLSIDGIDDLEGQRVAVVENTTTLKVLERHLQEAFVSASLEVVADHNEALTLLEDQEVDVVAADRATLLGQSLASEKLKVVRLAPIMLSLEPYAFPLPRNDADFRLLVNRALSDIYLTGQVNQIWQQWFGRYEARPSQLLLNVYRLNSLAD